MKIAFPTGVSYSVLAITSLSGGLTAAVTVAGRVTPTSASMIWVAVLVGISSLLIVWALLYARCLHLLGKLPWTKSVYTAALCHLPLLGGLGVVQTMYSDDLANHVFSATVYGQLVYRPLVLLGLVAMPAAMQLGVAVVYGRRWLAGHVAVVAPVVVALVLRLWNVDWQLPYLFHNDEPNYLSSAMMAWAHGDPNPHRFANPSLMFYLDIGLFNLLGGPRAEQFRIFAEAFGKQMWDPRGNYLVVLAARSIVALSGAATVGVVYLAAKELLGRRAALLASWFLAVSFLHVRNSHYATNDVSATFLAAVSFLFAAKLYRSGRWRDYLWAGVLGGLATSTKYNAGIFVLPVLVAHLARGKGNALKAVLVPSRAAPLLMSYAVSGIAFVLGTPYSVLDRGAFLAGFQGQLELGPTPYFGQEVLPTWWMHLTALVQGFGLLPLLLAAVGILFLLRNSPGPLAVVAVFPAGYYAFMASQQLYFARFTILMLPFVAILAGCGAAFLANRMSQFRFGNLLSLSLLLGALAQPTIFSIQSNLINGREDTRVLADRWISDNLPENGPLLVDDISDEGVPWLAEPAGSSRSDVQFLRGLNSLEV